MVRRWLGRLLVLALAAGIFLCAAAPAAAAYTGGDGQFSLTEEEAAYVKRHGVFRVGYVQDRIPVSFMDDQGELAGISRYIFDRVAAISGLEFEYVPLPNGSVTYDDRLAQGLDLITSVEYNKENQQARGILISDPYLSSRKVVVARGDLDFRYDAHLSVAISTGSQTIKKVMGDLFPNFVMVDYDSIAACFDAVSAGKADLMIQNQYVAEYWIGRPAYEGLKVISALGLEDQLCFSAVVAFGGGEGPSEEGGRLLIDILNKAIGCLTEDEVAGFTIQAVMEHPYTFTLSDFLYRYRYAVGVLVTAAVVIALLVVQLFRQRVRSLEDRADAKAKGEFLSTMSHEIRTPLNGLIGLNYLMAQNLGDRALLERYLQQSTSTAQYLLSLVNDILDMSQLQEDNLELARQPVDLPLLTSTVAAIVRGGMEAKQLDLQTDIRLPYPCVTGDAARIQQVLMNLLDNARKFTPEGGRVTLQITQSLSEDGGTVTTRAEVADTGRGMSEEFQKRAFRSFAQELDTVSKGNQGTGLGLPISRRLARAMGGDLTFTSKKGEGSRFFFTFTGAPAELPSAPATVPAAAADSGRPKVLVAEDNELNGEIMMELLEGADYEADLAENGRVALRMFSEAPVGHFGVILMDLLMPEMDGCEAAAIRALDRPDAKTVRIIACTANASAADREKALKSGMDDFLPKPIDMDELLRKLKA